MQPAELDRAQAGDPDAMDALLRTVHPLVLKRCARLLPYAADAEEAAQDALLAIATKLSSYSGTGSFEGWVRTIAANQARMTYRSLKSRRLLDSQIDVPDVADAARTSVIAGTRVDLLEAIDALERIHPETVEAFLLRDFGGHAYAEIARLTDVRLGTVKARIHTARDFVGRRVRESDNLLPNARI